MFTMKGLTTRQQEILKYIEFHFKENGYWPSIRDIQAHFGFKSTNSVIGHLKALEHKGVLERVPGQARAFKINGIDAMIHQSASDMVKVPLYGSIAAGYPDHVESSGEIGSIQIDASMMGVDRSDKVYALKVSGESMINAGIYPGDFVVVDPKQMPRNEDIVVALIDNETTLKRYINNNTQTPHLKAENPAYSDLVPVLELQVQGVVRCVVRCL